MEEAFWQERWRLNQTAFHEGRPNRLLLEHFDRLALGAGDTVFVPLCGKTMDLDWLYERRLRVVGIEFNREAVEEVFSRLSLVPDMQHTGKLIRFKAGSLEIFVGDFFELTGAMLGHMDAIYDRAALVALPKETRPGYAAHLAKIGGRARQLLISFDYDQGRMDGPPFSVPETEIRAINRTAYRIECLTRQKMSGPLGERSGGDVEAWLLEPEGTI
ncbi:thiopurine S-methyltransferase [Hoeflea sp.]|uniref:thiopurine S-methyltransferase n=1 Tax=Hoeflea sp. TaxID=1940281 RepID=UPI003B029D61